MKKNFNVNIAGIIFHIDEDAYEMLEHYLSLLRQHFAGVTGKEEILSDIESRIAEMLQTRLDEAKETIILADVEAVIANLGQPSEWEDAAETQAKPGHHAPKRLYRNPDNKVIGGVCSGLGAYFHFDPLWLRIAFILITIAGFGIGVIAYLLLWIFTPEARNTAEKLEMRGEKVTVSNIEKSIRQEFSGIKDTFNNIKDEAKDSLKRNSRKGATFFEKLFNLLMQIIRVAFKIVVVAFGLMFLAVGLFLLIGLLFSFIDSGNEVYISSFGISTFSVPALLRMFLEPRELTLALVGLILVMGIPLVLLIYFGARLIFKFKYRSRFIGIPAFSLILAGLVISVIVGLQVVRGFSQRAVVENEYTLQQPAGSKLLVDLGKVPYEQDLGHGPDHFMIGRWNLYQSGDTNVFFGIPSIDIVRSENDSFSLQTYAVAKGETLPEARKRASHIRYTFTQNDSALVLQPYYYMPLQDKIRNQELRLLLKVPVNKSVRIKGDSEVFDDEYDDSPFSALSNKTWVMTEHGLKEDRPLPPAAADTIKKGR